MLNRRDSRRGTAPRYSRYSRVGKPLSGGERLDLRLVRSNYESCQATDAGKDAGRCRASGIRGSAGVEQNATPAHSLRPSARECARGQAAALDRLPLQLGIDFGPKVW